MIWVHSPRGYDLGWIAPELVIRVGVPNHYIQFRDGNRIVDATIDSKDLPKIFAASERET